MIAFRTPGSEMQERMDCNYYHPRYVENSLKIGRQPCCKFAATYSQTAIGLTASVEPHYSQSGIGVPFVSGKAIKAFELQTDGSERITFESHNGPLADCKLWPGMLLVVRKGEVGNACVVPEAAGELSCASEVMFFEMRTTDEAYFFAAFFNAQHGRLAVERLQRGTIIFGVSLLDIPPLRVFWPDPKVRRYIGDKVRQAERLREHARALEAFIAGKFTFLAANLLPPKKAWWASHTAIDSYRINSPHYDAVVLDMLEKARAATGLVSLQSLVGPRDIAGGATPLGAEYPPDGVFFVRVQNVKPYRLDLSDAAYIDAATDEELKRSRCAEGDVILSITGYPGTASIVMAEDLPVNINQHSVRFDIVGGLSPEFVTAALNSPFLKKQVDRLAIGGTREALDYTSVGDLQIPILPKADRDEITTWVSTSNRCVRAASRLTTASKFLVEALIEGKVSEAELVAAQEALERGDDTADRALLRRLTRHGLDVAGQPPLFPDLDALYALLAQTQEGTE